MAKTGFFTNIVKQAANYWTNGGGKANALSIVEDLIYRIYIVSKSGKFYFPINPQSIHCKREADVFESNIINLGQVVEPRIPKLRQWSWEGLLMININDPLNLKGITIPPGGYIKMLNRIMEQREVVDFVYTSFNNALQYILDVNTKAIIKSFDWEERGGEPGDIYYNITIQEYRTYQPVIKDLTSEELNKLKENEVSNMANNEQVQREMKDLDVKQTQKGQQIYASGYSNDLGSTGKIYDNAKGQLTGRSKTFNGITQYEAILEGESKPRYFRLEQLKG